MQVFDENGKFLAMWPLRSPHWPANQNTLMVTNMIDQNGYIWVGDAPTSRLLKFDLNGNFLYAWGAPGAAIGTSELLSRNNHRSARKCLPRRLLRRTRAEVRTASRGGSAKDGRSNPADLGHLEVELAGPATALLTMIGGPAF
ncbi:MAG: hypothetical protein DMG13_26730 [Acidobacteria bacterium]|nr:MAG: hypothetical protein DMG13_26730 [Acidobacteriota bacterium]